MERRQATRAERRSMIDRRVAAVVLPPVSRVLPREKGHEPITRHLRDDRRRGDREALGVASHDLSVPAGRERGIEDAPAVDEDPVVLADLPQCPRHRDVARVIDVETVYLRDRRRADADAHDARPDELVQLLALRSGEQLGVLHAADDLGIGSDETGRCDDGPGERGHPDLVDADDAKETFGPELFLEAERRHAPRLAALLADGRGLADAIAEEV